MDGILIRSIFGIGDPFCFAIGFLPLRSSMSVPMAYAGVMLYDVIYYNLLLSLDILYYTILCQAPLTIFNPGYYPSLLSAIGPEN